MINKQDKRCVHCAHCTKQNLTKSEIAMSKKYLGRSSKTLLCIDCLANFLEVTSEELIAKIEEFKGNCKLFD
ncbi:MAG: hypothetical protein LBF12_04855 [Christensenellaceae bacterium]|jgi:hypothetical protein|nr:hypothetical protein [Christensenellaceae bacterium]